MPSYDYRCVNGHHTERFQKISAMEDAIECPMCGNKAEMIFITLSQARDAQPIDPVIVYKKRDGGYIYPGDSAPRDYPDAVRMELRTLGDLRHVAGEQDRLDREQWEVSRQREAEHQDPLRRERRAQLLAQIETNFGRDFLRHAIETNDRRRSQRRYTPGNFFEVAELDRSNREPQYDRRTSWKARRE